MNLFISTIQLFKETQRIIQKRHVQQIQCYILEVIISITTATTTKIKIFFRIISYFKEIEIFIF